MKEYSTIEMLNLAQLPENQGKEIKSTWTPHSVYQIKDKWIMFNNSVVNLQTHNNHDAKWRFEQKPVPFMIAAKSYKRIKLHDPEKYEWLNFKSELLNYQSLDKALSSVCRYTLPHVKELITEALWLIEE
jgi:hypothetical protein